VDVVSKKSRKEINYNGKLESYVGYQNNFIDVSVGNNECNGE
jgi:hypothetical protein